eukprot:Nk52_evm1s1810 gene=Nk52_evmTU1s1810
MRGNGMEGYLNQRVLVVTNDGRVICGILKGFDQVINVILNDTHERVFSPVDGMEQVVLGLFILRGDNIAVIGLLDSDLDSGVEWDQIKANPLNPVVH